MGDRLVVQGAREHNLKGVDLELQRHKLIVFTGLYTDAVTDSMTRAISETQRRRQLQMAYDEEHGIDPQTIRKAVTDILSFLRGGDQGAPVPDKDKRRRTAAERKRIAELTELPQDDVVSLIAALEEEMHEAAEELRFEYAARLRDEIKDLRRGVSQTG